MGLTNSVGSMSWETASYMASVIGTIIALAIGILAVQQYRKDSLLHRDGVAHEKQNELFRIALMYPALADGYFDLGKLPPRTESEREEACRYLWLYSAISTHLEFLNIHFGTIPDWKASIVYMINAHKNFILSTWHRDQGWWATYDPSLRSLMAEELKLDKDLVESWARMDVQPDRFDLSNAKAENK